MNIAIFLAHPRKDAFCHALAFAYQQGATSAGATVELFWLDGYKFDPVLHEPSPRDQPLEPGLREAQRLITWADHLVFVFPTWWATMPALLKGFFDRILIPGFAFNVDGHAPSGCRPLLGQRSARIITTMDTPDWVYCWIYGRPGELAIARGILGFCGIKSVHAERICRVKHLSVNQRQRVLRRVGRLGTLEAAKPRRKTFAWIRAMRLPFQGMTLCSYGLGVAAAIQFSGASPSWPIIFAGFLILGFIAIASVFLNEIHDLTTDQRNLNAGPFTGGSRVLVNQELFPEQLRQAAGRLLVSAVLLAIPVAAISPSRLPVLALLGAALAFGPGYTAPPLRLVYRGFGEPVVALTHTLLMTLFGWFLAGGSSTSLLPWWLTLPAACSVLSAIILAGIPDADADREVGKRTLAVRLGSRGACLLSLLASGGALLSAWLVPILASLYAPILLPAALHTVILLGALGHYTVTGGSCRRMDPLLFAALTHILWFTLGPLLLLLVA